MFESDRPAMHGRGHTITVEPHGDGYTVVERTDGRYGTTRAVVATEDAAILLAQSYAATLGAVYTPTPQGWLWDRLMTPAEVATAFRVDTKTVNRWAKRGKLKAIRTLGGHRRYSAEQVAALIGGAL